MYTDIQLKAVYSLLTDETNLIFTVNNPIILEYLGIYKNKKLIDELKNELYSVYDKNLILSICRKKQGKHGNNIRNSKKIVYSTETKEKMKKSRKLFWDSIKGTEKETELKNISKSSIKRINDLRLNQTITAKIKRIVSRKQYNKEWHSDATKKKIGNSQIGKIVSEDTKLKQSIASKNKPKFDRRGNLNPCKQEHVKQKISESISYLHRIGRYPLKIKSKGHNEIENILIQLGYEVINEYKLGKFSYDLFLPKLNSIIEFHGTYWHLDPTIYSYDYFDKSKNRKAYEQWNRDDIRKAYAISNGMRYLVIWQKNWEQLNDEEKILNIKHLIENDKQIC